MSDTPPENKGPWKIYDYGNYNPPKYIETCNSPREACKSLFIFSAHEMKNNRIANYQIKPPVDLIDWRELDLPSWAVRVLTAMEQDSKVAMIVQHEGESSLTVAMSDHFTPKYDFTKSGRHKT